jgi:biopolymer transport protein ExbD
MMIHRLKTKLPADIPEASTADIAFLLLIFFIVSTGFPDIALPLVLPQNTGEVTQVARANVMEIVTARTGLYYVGAADAPVPLTDLRRRVKEQLTANDKLIILLETHPQAPYGKMINALDEVMLAYNELDDANIKRDRRISIKMIEYE